MTDIAPASGELTAEIALARLIERHGTGAILRALLRLLLRRRPRRLRSEDLSDHLRRDIGLPERATPPSQWPPRF